MSGVDEGGGRTEMVWLGYLLFLLSVIVAAIFGGIALYGYSTGDGDLAKFGFGVIAGGLQIVVVLMLFGVGYVLWTNDLWRITDDDTGILYAVLTILSAVSLVVGAVLYAGARGASRGRPPSELPVLDIGPGPAAALAIVFALLSGVFIALERFLEGLKVTEDRGTDDDQHVTDRFH